MSIDPYDGPRGGLPLKNESPPWWYWVVLFGPFVALFVYWLFWGRPGA